MRISRVNRLEKWTIQHPNDDLRMGDRRLTRQSSFGLRQALVFRHFPEGVFWISSGPPWHEGIER